MGKFNFGLDASAAAEEELGEGFYAGPTPPKGVYDMLVKKFSIKKNANDDFRLSVLLEIAEPEDSDKAQYNGYGAWGGYNVTEQSRPWINNLLDAIGARRADFWAEKLTTSGPIEKITNKESQDVLKIGARKTTGHMVRAVCKFKPAGNGFEEGLEPQRFLIGDEAPRGGSSDVQPDDTATGLSDDSGTASDDDAATADDSGYSEEELTELGIPDLKAICDDWQLEYAAKATKPTLIKLILDAQNDDSSAEDGDADEDNNAEQAGLDEDALTEEDLESMDKDALVEYMTEKGWDVPKPAIPSRLRKLVLQYQAEPPF